MCAWVCFGRGCVCSRNVWGRLVPYERLRAGSSWRGGGAAAGAGAALLSVSVSKPGIDWVTIPHPVEVWLLLPSAGWSSQPSSAERCGPDWNPRFVASETPAQPFMRGFLCWALFLSSTLHRGASQLSATENSSLALCLSIEQAAVLWLRKFILWLLYQTKECLWMDFLLKTALAF